MSFTPEEIQRISKDCRQVFWEVRCLVPTEIAIEKTFEIIIEGLVDGVEGVNLGRPLTDEDNIAIRKIIQEISMDPPPSDVEFDKLTSDFI